jgi:hypothetical protein
MKNFITEYLHNSNELCIKFNITQNTTKLVYSIYGNNGICLKGLIENGLNLKIPKFSIDVETNTIFFIKTKSVINNEIIENFEFVDLNSIKQKVNLNMSILDKKTENLFKSINMDDLDIDIENPKNSITSESLPINTNQSNLNQNRFTGLIIEDDNEESSNSDSDNNSHSEPDENQMITDNSDNENS